MVVKLRRGLTGARICLSARGSETPTEPPAGQPAQSAQGQPRLPLSYYEALVPTPAGWDDRPCGYLLFGPRYEPMGREAPATRVGG